MLIFITGGVRSGKSNFAENLVTNMSGRLVYVATAKYEGMEMIERINKHQFDRRNKGFITFDKTCNLNELTSKLYSDDCVLIECLTTLVANEMFDNNLSSHTVIEKVFNDIMDITSKVKCVVVVSNDLYGDDLSYSNEVSQYYNCVTSISKKLVASCNEAYELSYSIAIRRK